jgi:hypothetical protein
MIVASGFPLRFLFGTVFLGLEISYWALIMLLYLSLYLLAGKRLSRNLRMDLDTDQAAVNQLELQRDFWKSTFTVLGAVSISSYLAFLADSSTQLHWGNSIVLFSVVPYSVFILSYFELVINQRHSGDATENLTSNVSFLALGFLWICIMYASRHSQLAI